MSHIVTIKTEVRDPAAIRSACQRLQLPEPQHGTFRLFSANATGWAVQLPEWRYPAVCETEIGQVHFDNYEGRWGDRAHLHRFLQNYAVEKTKLEARKKGYTVAEQTLSNGSIRLSVNQGA